MTAFETKLVVWGAVANALPEVKAVADVEAASNDEDGVARFIYDEILHG